MIDFHSHILPAVDDGSSSVEMSLQMLREEKQQGIDTVVLTPHFYASQNSPEKFLERRQRAWEKLSQYLDDSMPEIYLGAEVQYFEGICAVKEIRDLRIEGSNYLLLEMPFSRWSDRMIRNAIELNGWRDTQVVLAHIERYIPMQDKGVVEKMLRNGIMLQSNVSYFCNWKTKRKATGMLSKGEISFIGSDCHNMSSRMPNWDKLPGKVWDIAERRISRSVLGEHTVTAEMHK